MLLAGQVQRVVLQPTGSENCPPVCPALATEHPDGSRTVCISNQGGCATMDLKVDQVFRGEAGATRQFRSRIGEFGQSFPVTSAQVVVSDEAGSVHWAIVTERDGRKFIDPKRLWTFGGVPAFAPDDGQLVALDEVLARLGARR